MRRWAKAVEGWNDMGLGKFELDYLRDKEKSNLPYSTPS